MVCVFFWLCSSDFCLPSDWAELVYPELNPEYSDIRWRIRSEAVQENELRSEKTERNVTRFLKPIQAALIVLFLFAYALIAWNYLIGHVGLSYDEAWNYGVYSFRGPFYGLTHYLAPNNHLFTTIVNGFLPRGLVIAWPPLMRLLLPVYTAVLIYACWVILHERLKWPSDRAFLAALAIPISTASFGIYLLWIRGYLAGAAFLLLGIHELARSCEAIGAFGGAASSEGERTAFRKHMLRSILWLSLSIWCLPSFLLPAWIALGLSAAYVFFGLGFRGALPFALSIPVVFLIMMVLYSGVLSEMKATSGRWITDWSVADAFNMFLPSAWRTGFTWLIPPGVALVAPTFLLHRDYQRRKSTDPANPDRFIESRRAFLLLLLLGICLFAVLCTELAVRVGVLPPPFIRNVNYIAPFFWLSLIILPGRYGRNAVAAVIMIVPAVLLELSSFAGSPVWNLDDPGRASSLDRLLLQRNDHPPDFLVCDGDRAHACMIHARRWKIQVYLMEGTDGPAVHCQDKSKARVYLGYTDDPERRLCIE